MTTTRFRIWTVFTGLPVLVIFFGCFDQHLVRGGAAEHTLGDSNRSRRANENGS